MWVCFISWSQFVINTTVDGMRNVGSKRSVVSEMRWIAGYMLLVDILFVRGFLQVLLNAGGCCMAIVVGSLRILSDWVFIIPSLPYRPYHGRDVIALCSQSVLKMHSRRFSPAYYVSRVLITISQVHGMVYHEYFMNIFAVYSFTADSSMPGTGWLKLKAKHYLLANVHAVLSIQTVKLCARLLCAVAKTSPVVLFFCLIFVR